MPTSESDDGNRTDIRNEIFGPVLSIVSAETMDEAIEIINANK
jgi:malonate-semialdehyde dehydrogenase (acetylating)/methylmalonate-semialdehyde dehydrogenase